MPDNDPHSPPPFNSGHTGGRPVGKSPEGLVIAGYITGVLLPIVGFFVGFALVLKDRVAHGVVVMVLSVIVVAGAVAFATSDSDDGPRPVPISGQVAEPAALEADWAAYYRCLDDAERNGTPYAGALEACADLSP